MHKSLLLSFLIILLCISGLSAQNQPATAAPQQQWEYLVLEFGGTAGSAIITADKDAPPSKVGFRQTYYDNKVIRYGDNTTFQGALDEVGNAGWELVSVIPLSGDNTKSYIFKRQFDPVRSRRETAEVERLEKNAGGDIIKKPALVDLDRAEVKAADDAIANKAKERLEEAIKNAGMGSLVGLRTFYNSSTKETWAEVTIDGSAALLKDENTYRASEAKKYVSAVAAGLFKKSGLQQLPGTDKFYFENGGFDRRGEVVVNLSVIIRFNGKDNFVSRGAITGNWMAINKQE
jgi:hypothetical protein